MMMIIIVHINTFFINLTMLSYTDHSSQFNVLGLHILNSIYFIIKDIFNFINIIIFITNLEQTLTGHTFLMS